MTVLKEQWHFQQQLPQSVVEFVLEKLVDTAEIVKQADQAKKSAKCWYDKKARDDPIAVGEEVLVLLPEDSTGVFAQWHGAGEASTTLVQTQYSRQRAQDQAVSSEPSEALHPTSRSDGSYGS